MAGEEVMLCLLILVAILDGIIAAPQRDDERRSTPVQDFWLSLYERNAR